MLTRARCARKFGVSLGLGFLLWVGGKLTAFPTAPIEDTLLFSLPYGTAKNEIFLTPFGFDRPAEGQASTGPKVLMVTPDGTRLFIVTELYELAPPVDAHFLVQSFDQTGKLLAFAGTKPDDPLVFPDGSFGDYSCYDQTCEVKIYDNAGRIHEAQKKLAQQHQKAFLSLMKSKPRVWEFWGADQEQNVYFSVDIEGKTMLYIARADGSLSVVEKFPVGISSGIIAYDQEVLLYSCGLKDDDSLLLTTYRADTKAMSRITIQTPKELRGYERHCQAWIGNATTWKCEGLVYLEAQFHSRAVDPGKSAKRLKGEPPTSRALKKAFSR